jgi:hypothetical protein
MTICGAAGSATKSISPFRFLGSCLAIQITIKNRHCEEAKPTKQSRKFALDRHAATRLAMTAKQDGS